MKLATSPDRMTFQARNFLKRQAEKGLTIENDENTRLIYNIYEQNRIDHQMKFTDSIPQNNLEYDLRTSELFIGKVKNDNYAQHLYATLCNNNFFKGLMTEAWHCSWRYAGGIVADLRGEGDYIDWYLSGMRFDGDDSVELLGEGTICEEVRADLLTIGWRIEEYGPIDFKTIQEILTDAEKE